MTSEPRCLDHGQPLSRCQHVPEADSARRWLDEQFEAVIAAAQRFRDGDDDSDDRLILARTSWELARCDEATRRYIERRGEPEPAPTTVMPLASIQDRLGFR